MAEMPQKDECDFNGMTKLVTYVMEWYAKFIQGGPPPRRPQCEGCPYYEKADDKMTMCEYLMAFLLRVVVNR